MPTPKDTPVPIHRAVWIALSLPWLDFSPPQQARPIQADKALLAVTESQDGGNGIGFGHEQLE